MLAALGPRLESKSETADSGIATFGWWGNRDGGIAAVGDVIVLIDGFVYNDRELDGSGLDAWLIAALYRTHGFLGAIQRINGDFAIALYDNAENTLWLARDRFGVKPLYWASTADGFAFASRPAPLLRLPGVTREVNSRFVGRFAGLHYRYIDNDLEASAYAGISQLPAAHALRLQNGVREIVRYWRLEDLPDFTDPETELAERYRELLMDAVSIRLKRASNPVFTLSGGMDSSSVLAMTVRLTGLKQDAVSVVYADSTYDESSEIATMLDSSVRQWHRVSVDSPNVFEVIERMISAHDEPVATATWLSHYLLCEAMARQGFHGLFGGLGGDELNAGEYEYFPYYFADLRASGQGGQLAREVDLWVRHHDHPVFRKSSAVAEQALATLVDAREPGRCLSDKARLMRYASALDKGFFDPGTFEPVMDHPFSSYLKNRTYQDTFRETIPPCLRAEDRQTVAFGLDNLMPFFDHRLAEFMYRVPGTLKIRDGVTKVLLRHATIGILPDGTRLRIKKTGWNAPAHRWFSGPARDNLQDLIHSRAFRERGIYNLREVERLVGEHLSIVSSGTPTDNHMMFLWQLVNLELWLSALSRQAKEPGQ